MTKSPNSHPPINFAIEPKMYADRSISTGFTKYAKKVNGRFAAIGFVSLLATEILTGHSFIGLLKDILGRAFSWN